MPNLPWFIPQKREIKDTNNYSVEVDKSGVAETGSTETFLDVDSEFPVLKTKDGRLVKIKEFRDEAKRPWYKFFDEFEYREPTQKAQQHKWYHWFEPGTSDKEKKLLWKLDILIAFYSFVGYWVKYMDLANLNLAYVSNMKEDLNMQHNDLVNTQAVFTVGNIVFELPMMFLLLRVPTNYILLVSEMGWAIFTIFTYAVNNVSQLQALRFFVGAFEAAYFPSIHYILASWYKPLEISRRGALFYSGQFLGVLTAGLIQGSVFASLDGINGLAGWRWCFIIDGLISVVVALAGFMMLPGTPFSCYLIWLTDEEILIARKRAFDNGNDISGETHSFFNKEDWKKALGTWHVWLLALIQMQGFNSNNTSSGSFVLWLKSLKKYLIPKINNLLAAPPAVGIFYVLFICFGADLTRKRFGFVILSFIMNFIGNVILAVWDVPDSAKWFAFMSGYWSWSQSSVFNCLISDFFRKDNNVRSIAWMIQYIMGLQSTAWISVLIWPTEQAPRFPRGFATCAAFSAGFILFLSMAYFLYKRDERKEALDNGIYVYNSAMEGVPEIVQKYQGKLGVTKQTVEVEQDVKDSSSDNAF